jgi:hypothetical protein|tara:strand:+ start:2170 stop:2307 length:138 start_codon:yes stop_codon:yes gene_type:complete
MDAVYSDTNPPSILKLAKKRNRILKEESFVKFLEIAAVDRPKVKL